MRFPNVFSIILLVVFHTCLVNAQEEDSEEAIPDKVGAEIHLKKTERSLLKNMECQFCRAIMKEMHIEVARHDMTKKRRVARLGNCKRNVSWTLAEI